MKELKFFKCESCGNFVLEIQNNGPEIHCCGQPMVEQEVGTTDAAVEKHVPEITREGNKVKVQVGSTIHPMTEDHYIVLIAAVQGDKVQIQHLTPECEPKAEFDVEEGPVAVYEYCNLHGVWMAEA